MSSPGEVSTLKKELVTILLHNRDGSFRTQNDRKGSLMNLIKTVREKYKIRTVHSLKRKHLAYYVEKLKEKKLSIGTLKNHIAHARWLTQKINRSNILPRTNEKLGIGERTYVTNKDHSWTREKFNEIIYDRK